jgi:5-deoxy-glucuronate isomerase
VQQANATRERPPALIRPRALGDDASGVIVSVTPLEAGWQFISFAVRRLAAGASWQTDTQNQEACFVLLQGRLRVTWDDGASEHVLGPRASVFASYPHAAYVPAGSRVRIVADETSEIADCRVPSTSNLPARIVRPEDCGFEIRGGGNATRKIVDILPPAFPAERLLICEVYTPGGNWSSYPPHKHDVDNPPAEVALEETYYFRFRDPLAYAFQRIYTADGRRDETLKVEHNDLALIPDGYHPFVTAFGYDAYYLNVLAGTRRSMAASDDPRYAIFRKTWPPPDPRMPIVQKP